MYSLQVQHIPHCISEVISDIQWPRDILHMFYWHYFDALFYEIYLVRFLSSDILIFHLCGMLYLNPVYLPAFLEYERSPCMVPFAIDLHECCLQAVPIICSSEIKVQPPTTVYLQYLLYLPEGYSKHFANIKSH